MTAIANHAEFHSIARSDFATFAKKSFRILHPHQEFQDNWHIDALAHQLQRIYDGAISNLAVEMPPRSSKSFTCSVAYPVWYVGNNPGKTILVASRNKDLAVDLSNKSRKLMTDPFVQTVFPSLKTLIKDTETEIVTKSGGGRLAAWVDGSITGRGGDTLVMDDLVDASDAENEAACENVNHWVDRVYSTRKNQPATTPMINVMQRLSVFDLGQHLRNQDGWDLLSLPAIATIDEDIPIGGGNVFRRKIGDLLHDARYPLDYLEKQKRTMGTRAFEAQFQQSPILDGGGLIDLKEFARYDKLPNSFDNRFISVDPASGSESGSYTAFLFGRISNGRLFVEHVYRDRLDIAEQLKYLKDMDAKYIMNNLVVENSTPGKSLIELIGYEFRLERHLHTYPHYLQTVVPRGSKVDRMEAAMNHVRQGKVLLPKNAKWFEPFENEIRAFPSGKNNDQVDALSQAIKFFKFYETDACSRIQRGLPPL